MRYRFNRIELEGLVLRPSSLFSADLTGMFDLDKSVEISETTDHGGYLGMSRNGYKKLTLNVMIKNRYDFQSLLQLNGILAQSEATLKIDLEGLGLLTTKVVCQSKATSDDAGRAMSIELLMLDPYFSYKVEVAYAGQKGDDGEYGLSFPAFTPFTFRRDPNLMGVATINNYGNCKSWGEIEITGIIKNPRITNVTTGDIMYFNDFEMKEGDILKISCDPRNRYIVLNGHKRMDLRKGTWLGFDIGSNTLLFESDNIRDKASFSCRIKCVSRVI